jgi:hypothetical protein
MSRDDQSDPTAGDDASRGFIRLEQALKRGDFTLASLARDRLRRLGWRVDSPPPGRSPSRYSKGDRQ